MLQEGEHHSHVHIEQHYLEPLSQSSFSDIGTHTHTHEEIPNIQDAIEGNQKEERRNISFRYFPSTFQKESSAYIKLLEIFLQNESMYSKIHDLNVYIHKKAFEVRGKMKDRALHLFGILDMSEQEFLAVGIHEFAHYVDLYFLKKSVLRDVSDYFYDISWYSTRVMQSGSSQSDFVSGYAMTNKYEDFAESFTYYILHNDDFLKKTQNSPLLEKKYNFFSQNLFRQGEFIGTDFSGDSQIKDYYWDITKIDFSLEKLLIFLENGI